MTWKPSRSVLIGLLGIVVFLLVYGLATDSLGQQLKWMVLVFVTGFVAGFGKLLAEWMIKPKGTVPENSESDKPRAAEQIQPPSPDTDAKSRKKELKEQAKISKKEVKAVTKKE